MPHRNRRRSTKNSRPSNGCSLRDLASLAAVDVSTVSRALNNDPRISSERAQAIRKLADKAGYRPRPLRTRRTGAIGLLIASQSNRPDESFLERIALTCERMLGARHMHVHLECIQREPQGNDELPAVVRDNRVDGVLLAGHPPVGLVQSIVNTGMPAVAINDSLNRLGIDCVRAHPDSAIREAILRLAASGHQHFALLMTSLEFPTVKARYESYLAALRELAIEPDPDAVLANLPSTMAGGRAGVLALLKKKRPPTALICCNDWMALGALHELQRQGIHIPEQISVVGHDDLPFCLETEPTLTSIHRSEDAMAAQAIDLLQHRIEHPDDKPRELLIEEAVVWRASTGLAPERSGHVKAP